MTALTTATLLGLLVGGLLGGLGGGGAILAVPALVYLLDQSPQAATTGSLVVVGLSALTGVASYHRCGRVRWRAALAFGLLGAPGAWAGSRLNHAVDDDTLLLAFSVLMLLAAGAMVAGRTDRGSRDPDRRPTSPAVLVLTALGVGMLTGFLGVGGGFVVVPVLVLVAGLPMPVAVGTSLVVVAMNSAAALLSRLGGPPVDTGVVVPFAVAAMAAALLGKRVADRLPARGLTLAFAAVLAVVATGTAAQSLHDRGTDSLASGQASPST